MPRPSAPGGEIDEQMASPGPMSYGEYMIALNGRAGVPADEVIA